MQFLPKGRVAVVVGPLHDPAIYSDTLDVARAVLDSLTE